MNTYNLPENTWKNLQPYLPKEGSSKGGRPAGDIRIFLNALYWIMKTGAPWRALPSEYGSWKTVYSRFRRWRERGYIKNLSDFFSLVDSLKL